MIVINRIVDNSLNKQINNIKKVLEKIKETISKFETENKTIKNDIDNLYSKEILQ